MENKPLATLPPVTDDPCDDVGHWIWVKWMPIMDHRMRMTSREFAALIDSPWNGADVPPPEWTLDRRSRIIPIEPTTGPTRIKGTTTTVPTIAELIEAGHLLPLDPYAITASCDHDWQPGAEGEFAGLTEHCSKCGYER